MYSRHDTEGRGGRSRMVVHSSETCIKAVCFIQSSLFNGVTCDLMYCTGKISCTEIYSFQEVTIRWQSRTLQSPVDCRLLEQHAQPEHYYIYTNLQCNNSEHLRIHEYGYANLTSWKEVTQKLLPNPCPVWISEILLYRIKQQRQCRRMTYRSADVGRSVQQVAGCSLPRSCSSSVIGKNGGHIIE
jgi:hypothetical protein